MIGKDNALPAPFGCPHYAVSAAAINGSTVQVMTVL